MVQLVIRFLFVDDWCDQRSHDIQVFFGCHFKSCERYVLECLMYNLYECSRRYSGKMLVIKKIGRNFTNTGLTRENSLSECLTSKGTSIATGVVRSKRFFIDWFENCYFLLLDVSHFVGPTCSLISEFWLEANIESLSYLLYGFFHSFGTRY